MKLVRVLKKSKEKEKGEGEKEKKKPNVKKGKESIFFKLPLLVFQYCLDKKTLGRLELVSKVTRENRHRVFFFSFFFCSFSTGGECICGKVGVVEGIVSEGKVTKIFFLCCLCHYF
jgi:hypothetical protein